MVTILASILCERTDFVICYYSLSAILKLFHSLTLRIYESTIIVFYACEPIHTLHVAILLYVGVRDFTFKLGGIILA